LRDGPCQALYAWGRETARSKGDKSLGERLGIQDQAQRSEKGELEARIPEQQGVESRHDRRHQGQAEQADLAAAELAGEERQPTHQGGAQHAGAGSHQEGIQNDAQHRQGGPLVAAEQAAENGVKQAGDDGDIETADIKPIWTFSFKLVGRSRKTNVTCLSSD